LTLVLSSNLIVAKKEVAFELTGRDLVVDVRKDVTVLDCPGGIVPQHIAIIPLASPGNGTLGVAVDLTWIREMHYLVYYGKPLTEWRQKYGAAQHVETQRDVEALAIWPIVELARLKGERVRSGLVGRSNETPQDNETPRVSLRALRRGLQFEEGVETTILQYPELVALIDGVVFRFPEAYFIGDMDIIAQGGMVNRNPDWFRTFDGLPTRWLGQHCVLCGGNDAVVRHIIGPSRIVRCQACGLEYDNPQAVIAPTALNKYASDLSDQRKSAKSLVRAEQSAAILINGLTTLAPPLCKEPLLDIGCASGEILYVLREKYGWPNDCLWGVEPSSRSRAIARTQYGLNVSGDLAFPHGSFGTVSIVNTIEHLPNPRAVLARVYQLLAPGGRLLIGTVPNVGSLASFAFPEGFIAKNFPDGQHHYQFTPDTLAKLCIEEGFEVIRLDGETRESVLDKVKETAIWLGYSYGLPLHVCRDEEYLLYALKDLINRVRQTLVEQQGAAYHFLVRDSDFESVDAVIQFWRREIWRSPYLSDEFDLWLRKRSFPSPPR